MLDVFPALPSEFEPTPMPDGISRAWLLTGLYLRRAIDTERKRRMLADARTTKQRTAWLIRVANTEVGIGDGVVREHRERAIDALRDDDAKSRVN